MKRGKRHLFSMLLLTLISLVTLLPPSFAIALDRNLVTWDELAPSGGRGSEETALPMSEASRLSLPATEAGDRFDPLQMDVVQDEDWQPQSFKVNKSVLGRDVLVDGYVLPLAGDGQRIVEFLLVPWVGACIHTPAPPPNQIIHVSYPDGLWLEKPFEPVRLSGDLRHEPSSHLLFLVDGSRPIQTSYVLTAASALGTPGEIVAASASEVPALDRLQIWANSLFTDSMTALGEGGSTKALLFALFLSFGYGALHTLGPGHGKSVVISYFVGTGGNLRRGLTMGVRIAVFHVLSAVAVVFLFDFAVRQVTGAAPSDYRIVRLASYALIIAIGTVMLWQAVAAIRARRVDVAHLRQHGVRPGDPEHGHHHHEHAAHSHEAHSHAGCAACAAAANPKGGGWVAASVGLVPCTGALLVMLFGLANDLVWPAILMVAAISAGMAVAMSAIGIAALWGRRWAERRLGENDDRRVKFELGARFAGAVCVFAIGITLFGITLALEPIPQMPNADIAYSSRAAVLGDG